MTTEDQAIALAEVQALQSIDETAVAGVERLGAAAEAQATAATAHAATADRQTAIFEGIAAALGAVAVNVVLPDTIQTIKGDQGPQGDAGTQGELGPVGPQGLQGDPGADGVGLPGPVGPQGDPGAAGVPGAPGSAGADGADGRTVLNGSGPPALTVGELGDYYIDNTALTIYGPRRPRTWGPPTRLQGPPGPGGGGGAPPLIVKDEGTVLPNVRAIDFRGAGVTAAMVGTVAQVTIPGGGSGSYSPPIPQSDVTDLVSDLAAKVPTSRTITAGTGLTGGGTLAADRTLAADFGTGAGKVTQGDDARLSDARPPTGSAGGDLSGTYPNPSVVDDSHNHTASTAPGAGGTPADTVTGPDTFGDSPVAGVAAEYSRADHDHGLPDESANIPTDDQKAALDAANSPDGANPFATIADVPDVSGFVQNPMVAHLDPGGFAIMGADRGAGVAGDDVNIQAGRGNGNTQGRARVAFHGGTDAGAGGNVELLAGNGEAGQPGGSFQLIGGSGNDGATFGAEFDASGGTATEPGRAGIYTGGTYGNAGDVPTAQGDGTFLWAPPAGGSGSGSFLSIAKWT